MTEFTLKPAAAVYVAPGLDLVSVRPMAFRDVDEVARIHAASFTGFFLTALGAPFLREFYRFALQDPGTIAFVIGEEHRPLGFVMGAVHPANFYRRVFARGWLRFALATIMPVLRNPFVVFRILRRFSAVRQSNFEFEEALLMSIAVRPDMQKHGLGTRLVKAFLAEARRRGKRAVSLTTDRDGNDDVNRFYVHAGFDLSYSYATAEGRQMNWYMIRLAAQET
ncbi:MAG: GNAT family N-acetyltransferase [Chloroflexota bacterium]